MDENEETKEVAPDKHTIVHEFKSDGGLGAGGSGTISVDGNKVGEGRIAKTQPGISRSMILPMWALTTEHR